MRYANEEYALISIESPFLLNKISDRVLREIATLNISMLNVVICEKSIPNINFLKKHVNSNDINYEYNFENIKYLSNNHNQNSLSMNYKKLSQFTLDENIKLNTQCIQLDINLSQEFKSELIDKLLEEYNKLVILNPYFKDTIELSSYNKFITWVYESNSENIRLSNNHVHTNSLRQHPCHIGACSAYKCHMKKSGSPKNILINKHGESLMFSKIYMGNVKKESLRSLIAQNKEFYLDINKEIFCEEIINYSYDFFPWKEYFIYYSEVISRD